MQVTKIIPSMLIIAMTLFAAATASAQTLPQGQWAINGNSFEGQLNITSIDANGNLQGTVYGQQISGFWDGTSQKITFMRLTNPSDPSTFQIYTGFLFRNQNGGDMLYTLTGFFEAFQGTGGVAQRVLYGWFAQINVPG